MEKLMKACRYLKYFDRSRCLSKPTLKLYTATFATIHNIKERKNYSSKNLLFTDISDYS